MAFPVLLLSHLSPVKFLLLIPLGLTLKACKVEEIFVQIRLFLLADKVDW